MRKQKTIIIVGAGVMGLCTAYYASQNGHHVRIIDHREEPHENCSHGNAGYVAPSHFVPLASPGIVRKALGWMWNPASPFYLKPRWNRDLWRWCWLFFQAANPAAVHRAGPLLRDINLASRTAYRELAQLPGFDFGLELKGLYMLCRTPEALADETLLAERSHELGMPVELLDAQEMARREPDVRMDIQGAVFHPLDCHLLPHRFMEVMRNHLAQAGVEFHWRTKLKTWRTGAGSIRNLETSTGDFRADEYVVCSGAWSSLLLRDLGFRLPMEAGKGYSLTLPNPRFQLRTSAILKESRVAMTPMNGMLRVGGTMEIAGLNEQINPVRVRGITQSVQRYYPEFREADFNDIPVWHGLRPCSPDGLPYVGRAAGYDNLLIATGHAMMGMSLGPVTGQIMAALIQEEKPALDINLLNPNRYE